MSVGVIIVNYFTEELLIPLVARLVTFPLVSQVVVFDNGSATRPDFEAERVHLLGTGENIGFAAAVNRAFTQLNTDYVLLLNPDVMIEAPALERLLAAARRHLCPLVGPRYFWDEAHLFRLPPATGELRWLGLGAEAPATLDGQWRGYFWAQYQDRYWAAPEPFRLPFLPGACMLLARDWVRARGRVFDERYFMYYEDTDLCIEAQREGWMPLCVPGAEVVHFWDQSPDPSGGKARMLRESGLALRRKHHWPESDPLISLASGPELPGHFIHDLGVLATAPRFSLPPCPAGTRFEIAIDPGFVPFAQTQVSAPLLIPASTGRWRGFSGWRHRQGDVRTLGGQLQLPAALWGRLRPRTYFARLRHPDGIQGQHWRWRRGEIKS